MQWTVLLYITCSAILVRGTVQCTHHFGIYEGGNGGTGEGTSREMGGSSGMRGGQVGYRGTGGKVEGTGGGQGDKVLGEGQGGQERNRGTGGER